VQKNQRNNKCAGFEWLALRPTIRLQDAVLAAPCFAHLALLLCQSKKHGTRHRPD